MDFIPDQPKQIQEVPFYEDVTAAGGWQGHSTSKSISSLKSEITASIGRLGGLVTGFQRGTFMIGEQAREGFQIHYVIEQPDGGMMRGRLDVAALPVRKSERLRRSYETRKDKSLRMALYMLRNALDGTWFLQQLSPGYAPLMPWMLEANSGKSLTQLWSESAAMRQLLPPSEGDFIDGDFEEIEND